MFKEIEINGAKLRIYETGVVERFINNKFWKLVKGTIHINNKSNYKCHHIQINKKKYITSRIICHAYLGLILSNKELYVDHIDRNSLNNNVNNLRLVSPQVNQFNTDAKGYYLHSSSRKFIGQIRVNGKAIYLGMFDTAIEAREAYLKAKPNYHKF
jgi:hypothetical protein